jgi:transcriptional regulator with PAS, ATPase and Fis domain
MSKKEKQYKYLVVFLQKKTQSGEVKQIELADFVGRSPSFINSIIWDKRKKNQVDRDLVEKIAGYFGIPVDKMLNIGKSLLEKPDKKTEPLTDRRAKNPDSLINQALWLVNGIREMADDLQKKERETAEQLNSKLEEKRYMIGLFKNIFKELDEGITIFDKNRELIYSSNRWGLLDSIDTVEKMTLESIMLHTMHLIKNFEEVKNKLWEAYHKQKRKKIIIKLKSEDKFIFRVVPLYNGTNEFDGILIINTPVFN